MNFFNKISKKMLAIIAVVLTLVVATVFVLSRPKQVDQNLQVVPESETSNNSRVQLQYESSSDRYSARANSSDPESYALSSADLESRKEISNSTLSSAAQSQASSNAVDNNTQPDPEPPAGTDNNQQTDNNDGSNNNTNNSSNNNNTSSESDIRSQARVVEDELHRLLNNLRAETGAGSLERVSTLNSAALIRAEEATTSFSHTRPSGSDFYTVLDDVGYSGYSSVGENLAYRTSNEEWTNEELKSVAQKLFTQWVNSEGHYNNMVNAKFNKVGVGVKIEGNRFTAAQVFVKTYF